MGVPTTSTVTRHHGSLFSGHCLLNRGQNSVRPLFTPFLDTREVLRLFSPRPGPLPEVLSDLVTPTYTCSQQVTVVSTRWRILSGPRKFTSEILKLVKGVLL